MAENKKSFILYSDLIHTVSKLPNEKAGELFKHILKYVNDENPETEDLILQIAFEPIKLQLKRDLAKWENYIEKQRVNGKNGGRPKKPTDTEKTQAFLEKPKKADTVTVNVTDNVKERVNELAHSHLDVVKETLDNEIFLEQSAMALSTDLKTFKEFVWSKLDEMAITGQSSKYPLGTVKRIIMQDFKLDREAKKRFPQKEEVKPTYHKRVKFTDGEG